MVKLYTIDAEKQRKKICIFTFFVINGILVAMKKTIGLLIFLLICGAAVTADTVRLGAYAGYFAASDNTLKEIYKGEDVTYGLKLGVRVWDNFFLWLSGGQFKQNGETSLLKDPTQLTMNPLNLSLRYTFKLGKINPYLGVGYSYILYKEESDIGSYDGEGKGYSVDAGLEFRLSRNFLVDIGVTYTDTSVGLTDFGVQLGGAQAGMSFLVSF